LYSNYKNIFDSINVAGRHIQQHLWTTKTRTYRRTFLRSSQTQ